MAAIQDLIKKRGKGWLCFLPLDLSGVYHCNEIIVETMKGFSIFKDKEAEQFYWRMVRDVRKGLPYAKLISATVIETYEYISTLPTKKEREDYLKEMEKEVFNQYKPELKRFSRQQARVLVKLVNRETNQRSYSIIKAFLGGFRATFYQAFGRLFSVNLKADWKPETDATDAMINRIATRIEQGTL